MYSIIAIITLIVISIALIPAGAVLLNKPDKYNQSVVGTVSDAFCVQNSKKKYDCTVTVKYNVDGKEYSYKTSKYNQYTRIYPGVKINLRYEKGNPSSATDLPTNKTTGIILISIGGVFAIVLLVLIAWILYSYFKK